MNISGPDEARDATLYNMNFGLFQKNQPPLPTDGVVFNPPPPPALSPGFPETQESPPVWISNRKDLPSRLDIPEKKY